MDFQKGNVVKIKAVVKGVKICNYENPNGVVRELRRYRKRYDMTGIVLGYSFVKTGKIKCGGTNNFDGYEPACLEIEESHRVIVVEPFEQYNTWVNDRPLFKTNRYLEPVRCLEDDLEILT